MFKPRYHLGRDISFEIYQASRGRWIFVEDPEKANVCISYLFAGDPSDPYVEKIVELDARKVRRGHMRGRLKLAEPEIKGSGHIPMGSATDALIAAWCMGTVKYREMNGGLEGDPPELPKKRKSKRGKSIRY